MGYDTLEDNEMAALDGSRTGGNFANDIAIRTKRVIAGSTNTNKPVNVSAVIKSVAKKYSKPIASCEEANEVLSIIETDIQDTISLISECKLKKPFNKTKMLKLRAYLLALKEQLEFVKLEKIRLECLEEMKNGDEYANVTDVTMTTTETGETENKPDTIIIRKERDIDPMVVGMGLLAIAILGYITFGATIKN